MRPFLLLLLTCTFLVHAVDVPPPISLKMPGGEEPARLEKLQIAVRVRGVIAEVDQTMTFFNPNNRALAGDLDLPLADDATVAGYALDVEGQLVAGVPVPAAQARAILSAEARQRIDPGLVELVRGNVFRTRIFPLPANGRRTVRVTSVQPLVIGADGAACQIRLPRTALPELVLDVDLATNGVSPVVGGFGSLTLTTWEHGQRAHAVLRQVTPDDDLRIRLPRLPALQVQVEELLGERFLAISAPARTVKQKAPRHLGLAWDASGSRTPAAIQRDRTVLSRVLTAWRPKISLLVVRDTVSAPETFTDATALLARLDGLAYDGGTRLGALDLRGSSVPGVDRWLLTGDCLTTLDESLPLLGDVPVWPLVSESARDLAAARLIAALSGGCVVAAPSVEEATAALQGPAPVLPILAGGPGVLAEITSTLQGDRALLLARVQATGTVTVDGVPVTLPAMASGSVLARAWAGARCATLGVFPQRHRDELLFLGQRYGVVTPGCSLLVLETLDQHLRYGIAPSEQRPALREQYLLALKGRQDRWTGARAAQRERLVGQWQARLRWYTGNKIANANGVAPVIDMPMPGIRADVPPAAPQTTPTPTTASAGPQGHAEDATTESEQDGAAAFGAIGAGEGASGQFSRRSSKSAMFGSRADSAPATIATIAITAWDPRTPWLIALREAAPAEREKIWLTQRRLYDGPAFILDCAGYLLPLDRPLGLRVLSNLAELRLDHPDVLRVYAWRLREAGELDQAVWMLRRVLRLRPDEAASHRDLATVLAERAQRDHRGADLSEAMDLLRRVVERDPLDADRLGNVDEILRGWDRLVEVELITLEELNRLLVMARAGTWDQAPATPTLDSRLVGQLDCDLRVVLAWDTDGTDVDLHIDQSDGEHAFYGHNRTRSGGLVSADCTQGYGPEEYLIRRAPAGLFRIGCHFFGNRQQTVLGPTTVTATVYTNWGRPDEQRQLLTLRLERSGDRIAIGTVALGTSATRPDQTGAPRTGGIDAVLLGTLRTGMSPDAVRKVLGVPNDSSTGALLTWTYRCRDGRTIRLAFAPDLMRMTRVEDGAEVTMELGR